ncbi:small redox-active disulfide protein 2 [Desulfosporosinus acidiphilus SJ4]|uniref:Small redox-active disulfide protein 2 n=1 Tax=Desulfosporosinus acidiphilus (strain DSM 22704 / JCM 16185 / SJ4) TaxID=646529 RepID=I4D494_DESAJ|nr:thioredoxin family protein [Desulfosporosinus acidiphilus]AFM40618.1 small redox-active disulfide protein 2 [Desulfosporosinus acidiphilus SJ4]
MEIKILGSGCANCKKLEANAKAAIAEIGIDASITKVEDIKEVMKYGVMRTPGFVINEKVKSYGKVLSVAEIIKLIQTQN